MVRLFAFAAGEPRLHKGFIRQAKALTIPCDKAGLVDPSLGAHEVIWIESITVNICMFSLNVSQEVFKRIL